MIFSRRPHPPQTRETIPAYYMMTNQRRGGQLQEVAGLGDMSRAHVAEGAADIGLLHLPAVVDIGAAQLHLGRAGKGGFGKSGVGAAVLPPLAYGRPEGGHATPVEQLGRHGDDRGRELGRDVVSVVVDAGGDPAEVPVGLVLVPDHGVEGVHHLVGRRQRAPPRRKKKSGEMKPSTRFSPTVSNAARDAAVSESLLVFRSTIIASRRWAESRSPVFRRP